jgi:ABC-type amino acid transport substrate-binding protein
VLNLANAAGTDPAALAALNTTTFTFASNMGGTNEAETLALFGGASLLWCAVNEQQFAAVRTGRADGALTDQVEAEIQVRINQSTSDVDLCFSTPLTPAVAMGFVLPRSDVAWQQYVNAWLQEDWLGNGQGNASFEYWVGQAATQNEGQDQTDTDSCAASR